ncbi:MAG: class I SAM-dependent methyltransferase, partial [Gemmatimonadetes bacterium]|nr:class I SAM-dependent methyltransferase [Gemmatimonadota bacterium]
TDLQLESTSSLGPHYAETLRRWRSAFRARRADARELGYGESFLRLWDYYLAYCEAGFREDYVDDVQVRFRRPGAAT